ncbi:hypothetical protein [Micromonospora sp. NPDC049891]|uniref:hypothetical protein n=1 Tax=Micromonospora sp. NPDC049891 TaxID=3155655 RepID=UPI0033E7380A
MQSTAALDGPSSLPTDPLEVFKRNVTLAAESCGTCRGQKSINLPPAERTAAIRRLIDDSNENFRLSEVNADAALRGPQDTRPQVAGPGGEGADVTFLGAGGTAAFRREVKCLKGGNFSGEMSRAARQVKYDGEVFVQMPAGTDVGRLLQRFWGGRTDADLAKYRGVWVTVHDPDGKRIGAGMLGLRGMTM